MDKTMERPPDATRLQIEQLRNTRAKDLISAGRRNTVKLADDGVLTIDQKFVHVTSKDGTKYEAEIDSEAGRILSQLWELHRRNCRQSYRRAKTSKHVAAVRSSGRGRSRSARCSAVRTTGSRRTTSATSGSASSTPGRCSDDPDLPGDLAGLHSRFPIGGASDE